MGRTARRVTRTSAAAVAVAGVLGGCLIGGPPAAADAVSTHTYAVGPFIGVDPGATAVAVDPDTHIAYVADYEGHAVSVVDEASNTVVATVSLGVRGNAAGEPIALAVDPDTHRVYVANSYYNKVSVIDETTDTVTATIDGVGVNPDASLPFDSTLVSVAIDPDTHTAYVTSHSNESEKGTVSVIDEASNTVSATISLGLGAPGGLADDPVAHTLYVANPYPGTVTVIDEISNTVRATVPVGRDPAGVALDPVMHTAYVTNLDDNTVSVIDETSNTVTATIGVGRYPEAVAVDPVTRTAYVTNLNDNTVSVIDETSNTVTATLVLGPNVGPNTGTVPGGVAVDPTMHTAYVTGSGYSDSSSEVAVITQDPTTAPSVRSVTPRNGTTAGGQTVTITGSGFTGATRVMFGRTPATSFTVDSDSQITAVSPAHTAGSVRVRVATTELSPKTPGARYKYR